MAVQLIALLLQAASHSRHWIGLGPRTLRTLTLATVRPVLARESAQAQTLYFAVYEDMVHPALKSGLKPAPSTQALKGLANTRL